MAMLTDETIVAYINECLVQGLPTNLGFDVRSESVANELRIDIRFQAVPSKMNLSKLLLQIHPPEEEAQAPEKSRQALQDLMDKSQSTVTGKYADVRTVRILFSVPRTFRCVVCEESTTINVTGTTNEIEETLKANGWYKGGSAYYCPSHSAHLIVVCAIQDFNRTKGREPTKIFLTKDMQQQMDEVRKREARGDPFRTVAQDGTFLGKEIVFNADTFRLE